MTSKPGNTPGAACPICGRPTDAGYRPFCSRRCADIDLSRWLSGAYAIPDEAETGEEEAAVPTGEAGKGEHGDRHN